MQLCRIVSHVAAAGPRALYLKFSTDLSAPPPPNQGCCCSDAQQCRARHYLYRLSAGTAIGTRMEAAVAMSENDAAAIKVGRIDNCPNPAYRLPYLFLLCPLLARHWVSSSVFKTLQTNQFYVLCFPSPLPSPSPSPPSTRSLSKQCLF